jgi:hypothetical protein
MTLFITAVVISSILFLTFIYRIHVVKQAAEIKSTQLQDVVYKICSKDKFNVTSVTIDASGATRTLNIKGNPLVDIVNGTIAVDVEFEVLGDFVHIFAGDFNLCEHTICPVVKGNPSVISFNTTAPPQNGKYHGKMRVYGADGEIVTCVRGSYHSSVNKRLLTPRVN